MTDATTMLAMGYSPHAEMPPDYKDGRLVLLGDPDVGWDFPMRWNPRGYNIVFSREKVGIWEMDGGGMTWTDEHPGGARLVAAAGRGADMTTPLTTIWHPQGVTREVLLIGRWAVDYGSCG
jgi:hypothetical protein